MKAYEYILSKQVQWALNRGITLVGSREWGRPAYTSTLEENLFEPLAVTVRECFENADGAEVMGSQGNPAKMQAVHWSSALGVNIFQYWQKIGQIPVIAASCGFCRKGNSLSQKIVFEDKYAIDEKKFRHAPNIDVVIHNSDLAKVKRFAVECKFTEAYSSRGHSGLKPEYLNLDDTWHDIPHLYNLSRSLCPDDNRYFHLHPAQLVKHILGLKRKFGKDGFRLLYLWYDVLGEQGSIHQKEIEAFSETARADGIKFHSLSYQQLIMHLCSECRSGHEKYIEYISARYL